MSIKRTLIVFRNQDKKVIRQLLKEIGRERYECALADAGLIEQPPISMDGFYIEYDTEVKEFGLFYRYPSRSSYFIMSVLGYWNIPLSGWEYERKAKDG
ncbi:hypothetical protein FK220_012475 [Flavobacteriaceae bacterium TP-CH-4]|uniref:Uncharacterized protein n=1 Tax=Pelagihabitans pacificus TaxID=2696054 RepID=A0A967E702_9FLAO|nr:hypothetical protein [Pelagihabitans pacificus]NHF60165.1 hypothetical protein [Pelagihabitans pacificus]